MTRLPDYVLIGPYRYSIVLVERVKPRGSERIGRIMFRKLRIEVSNKVSVGRQQETLLHEILHGLWETVGLADGEKTSDESVIKALSPLLLDTLRRNPDVLAYLLETDE